MGLENEIKEEVNDFSHKMLFFVFFFYTVEDFKYSRVKVR
jgi:hypothetical protein